MAKWKLVSKHEYEFVAAVPRYVKTLGGFLIGVLMTAGGIALLVFGTGGDNISNTISAYIFGILLTLIGLLLAGFMILFWPWQRISWVRTYEEGLRWKAGGQEHKKRWDEVTSVNRMEEDVVGSDGRRTDWTRMADIMLRFADGTAVSFDPALSDYSKLARIAQESAAAHQLAEAAVELDEKGKTFGLVHIARDGVTAHGRFFPWKEVRWLAVHNGELCAHHWCEKWEPIPLEGISDYVLLLALLKGMGRLRE